MAFSFDSDTLRYLLQQLKVQIDKKVSKEKYAVKAEATDANALTVGVEIQLNDPLIVDLINKNVNVVKGDKVLIKDKVLSEAIYTQEEKDAIKEIIEGGGITKILDERLDGLDLEVVGTDEYEELVKDNALVANRLYIVSNDEFTAFRIDDYILKAAFVEEAAKKVDKVTYVNKNGLTVEKTLSQVNFTEAYQAVVQFILDNGGVDGLVFNNEIIDNLENDSVDRPLSANQGRVLKEEWLGNKKHAFKTKEEFEALNGNYDENTIYHITDADVLYGLTEEQLDHLKVAYEHSLRDYEQEYAKKSEVYQARQSLNGTFYKTLGDRLDALDETINDLYYDIENISNAINGVYGVQYDFEDQVATRLYNAVGKESSDFDFIYPWSEMRRCNLKDGKVLCYEGEEGYVEDGSNGDVMVEIPKFWYKVVPVELEDAASGEGQQIVNAKWLISNTQRDTFKCHPAFIRNSVEVDHIYVGAFEAGLYDVSAKAYGTNDTFVDIAADYLVSVSGTNPKTNLSMEYSRILAQQKGEGYGLYDINTLSALQLLLIIEYASFNSQACVGQGIVNREAMTVCNALPTGSSEAIVYRGIENLWGNVWQWVDGISFNNYNIYRFINETEDTKLSFKLYSTAGWIDKFGYDSNNDFVFLPARAAGSSSIAPYDYGYTFNQQSTNTSLTLCHGGKWSEKEYCGMFLVGCDHHFLEPVYFVGARILFHKN